MHCLCDGHDIMSNEKGQEINKMFVELDLGLPIKR
jgi:hypothetical protein